MPQGHTSASPGMTLLPRHIPDVCPEMSWDTFKLARQINLWSQHQRTDWIQILNPGTEIRTCYPPPPPYLFYLLIQSIYNSFWSGHHKTTFSGRMKHIQTHLHNYTGHSCAKKTLSLFFIPETLSSFKKYIWWWFSGLFYCKSQVIIEITRSSPKKVLTDVVMHKNWFRLFTSTSGIHSTDGFTEVWFVQYKTPESLEKPPSGPLGMTVHRLLLVSSSAESMLTLSQTV